MAVIIGHAEILRRLERLGASQEIPQSFLFAGPRHLGKRRVAEWFACTLAGGGVTSIALQPDTLVVEPEIVASAKQLHERLIPIERMRQVKQFLALSPSTGKYRVVIIDQAEKLSSAASDALLKVLEEPPRQSLLILISAEPQRLAATLLSRVVFFFFQPVESSVLRAQLPEATDLPAFFFDLGLPGVIASALEAPEQFLEKKEQLRTLFQISKLSQRARIDLAEALSKHESATRDLLEIWLIGLLFQARSELDAAAAAKRYHILTELLATLQSLAKGEGASRSLLEKFFVNCP